MHPDRELLFRGVDLFVGAGEKISIIGGNGTGKSTLLGIMSGALKPAGGELSYEGTVYCVPQHFGQYDGLTVAGALGVEPRIAALRSILAGDVSEANYAALDDDWQVEEHAESALARWGMGDAGLMRRMSEFSGGEKTRIFLAGIELYQPSSVLMDEPTNHLDTAARRLLYETIRLSKASIVVVSHDRALLNLIGTTYELTPTGLVRYGGNYEFYKQQREQELHALQSRIEEKGKALRLARRTATEAMERKNRENARGARKQKGEGVPRIMMDTIRGKAEATTARLKDVHSEKIGGIADELHRKRQQLPPARQLKVDLDDSALHRGKLLIEARDMNFGYGGEPLWEPPLTFRIESGDRIVVRGDNGSGKTTLMRIILGLLEPLSGIVRRTEFTHLYLDQDYSLIDDEFTVFGQVSQFNGRCLPEHEIKTLLHRFLFPAGTWDKRCSALSGGEKMRLVFCCLLASNGTPDLFVLDEPTNNLDIQSLETVTAALREYRGTVLVISHDDYFIGEIGAGLQIVLERNTGK